MVAQLRHEEVTDRHHIFKDENESVGRVPCIALAVKSVGEVLEQSDEIGDALDLASDLGVVWEFGVLLVDDPGGGRRKFLFLVLVHFPQFVHQFLDQGQVEALGQQLQYLLEHVQEGRSEFLEVELQRYKDWLQQMLEFFIVRRQFFGVVFSGQKLFDTLVGRLSNGSLNSPDQFEHHKDNFESFLGDVGFLYLAFLNLFGDFEDCVIDEDALEEFQNRRNEG